MEAMHTASTRFRRLLDGFERVVLFVLLGLLAYRLAPDVAEKPFNLVYLMAEGVVVLLVACRRSTDQVSLRPGDWLIGFAGTFLPLLVHSSGSGLAAGAVLMLLGFSTSAGAQLSLRRSFGVVAANRGVKTQGLYALVRHPMYVGYFFTNTGFLLMNPTIWNAAVAAVWICCQIYRIQAEERLLSQDVTYAAFKTRVPYRLVPYLY